MQVREIGIAQIKEKATKICLQLRFVSNQQEPQKVSFHTIMRQTLLVVDSVGNNRIFESRLLRAL